MSASDEKETAQSLDKTVKNNNNRNGGIKMNISVIISTFRDLIYPVLGMLTAVYLISFIPGISADENVSEKDD